MNLKLPDILVLAVTVTLATLIARFVEDRIYPKIVGRQETPWPV